MAFDRPLNVGEDPRIATVTSSSGFYANPPPSDGAIPPAVYYPATVSDATFVPLGLGFNNGVSGWVQHVVSPQTQTGLVGANTPNLGTRVDGCASDRASEYGCDDSVSGRKIKFLCSFGGQILPRLSDGALRYVGGQTRIISVRKDASFGEFIQKMTDTYVPNVVIKYQLPDEDLDALVTVSCPDDLENMMDEYEKLIERSSDGSAKLRIFLFSPSELETASLVHIGDLQDSGQRYVEAVNGITNGFSGRIARKESIESAISAQNSDFSANEVDDSLGHGLGEVTGLSSAAGLSHEGNPIVSSDTTPRMVSVNPNPVQYIDPLAPPLSIPVIKSGTTTTTSLSTVSEQEVERSVPLNFPQAVQPAVSYPPASPYYVEPHQETLNHANYVQLPSQMGYPAPVLTPVRPVFTQPGASGQQFTPAIHMTMNPSFMSMKHNAVVQPQQVRMEQYPVESMVGQSVVQLPAAQAYNPPSAQVPTTVQGGVYNWHPEKIAFAEGGLPPQPVMLPDKVPRLLDCLMCQKALPHAHSDTIAQEPKESPAATISDLRSIYSSLHLDGRGRPLIRPVLTGPMAESNNELAGGTRPRIVVNNENYELGKIQTETIGVPQNVEGQFLNDKIIPHPELPKVTLPQGVMMTSGVSSPYGVFMANIPQSCQANAVQNLVGQPQLQVIQDATMSKPLNNDVTPVGMPLQTKDYVLHESPKEYLAKVAMDDPSSSASDHLKQIDERLGNLRIRPSEVLSNNDPRKEDPTENRQHQIAANNFPPTELYEVTEPPPTIANPSLYSYSVHVINHFPPSDTAGNSVYSGVEPPLAAERTFPVNEWKDNVTWSQSKMADTPSYGVGDIPDNSTSLFSNQDPWNMKPDTHFPPPRPSKIQIRKETSGLRDHLGDNRLETQLDDGVYQQPGNLNHDFSLDHSLSNKGSAEELIKQELQAVAEGVASSVLHSSVPSNPDTSVYVRSASPPISQQNGDVQPANVEIQHKDKLEEIKTKYSEKINLGFPASGIGRLQIIRNSDLEELRELGSGTFGTVYHGKWRGTDVAIKRINDRCFAGKPSEQDRMRDDFWNEAIKLADLHHPNVVAFYGVVLDGPDGSVATVTEYMVNGSLRNALQKNERNLDKRKRLLIGMDVAFGMEYLHGKNIVHFDLKSDNLLVNLRDPHRPICKVGDLGLSKVKCHTLISGGVRGTLPWMAPELLNGSSSLVSEKVDVFSFGIVMWELLTGEEPYADLHYGAIIGGIVSNTLRPPVPEPCDPDWRDLMERCWSSEPSERPNFTNIANELRAMATKLPTKGQAQQQLLPSTNPQVKS